MMHWRWLAGQMRSLRRESLDSGRELVVTSGSGEFQAVNALRALPRSPAHHVSLTSQFGPELAACAPAYAVAVLATERPS